MNGETKCTVCSGDLHGMAMHAPNQCVQELRRQIAERDKRIAELAGRATAFDKAMSQAHEREDTHKAEIDRLHCIMLVLVGEAALALGDDHELVERLRAIRERTIDEAAQASKEKP